MTLKSRSSPAITYTTILIRSVPETTPERFILTRLVPCLCQAESIEGEKTTSSLHTNTRHVPTNHSRLPKGFQGFILSQKTPLFSQRLFAQSSDKESGKNTSLLARRHIEPRNEIRTVLPNTGVLLQLDFPSCYPTTSGSNENSTWR